MHMEKVLQKSGVLSSRPTKLGGRPRRGRATKSRGGAKCRADDLRSIAQVWGRATFGVGAKRPDNCRMPPSIFGD